MMLPDKKPNRKQEGGILQIAQKATPPRVPDVLPRKLGQSLLHHGLSLSSNVIKTTALRNLLFNLAFITDICVTHEHAAPIYIQII